MTHNRKYPLAKLGTHLSSNKGAYDGQQAIISGRASVLDGGEGMATWDESSTATEDQALVWGSGPAGRWLRELPEPGVLNARWWGMHPSASAATNAAALQAALDACEEGWTVVLPSDGFTGYANNFAMTGVVDISVTGVTLRGSGRIQRAGPFGSLLRWDAAGGLNIDASDVVLQGLVLSAAAGVTTPWLLKWDSQTSALHCKGVRFEQHASATVTDAVVIAETVLSNCEHGVFETCSFVTNGRSHVRIGASGSGQSKRHRFTQCYFAGFNQSLAQRSVTGVNIVTGSAWLDGGFATNLERLVNIVNPTESVSITEMDTEGCKRLIDFASGDVAVPIATGAATAAGGIVHSVVSVTLRGGRHSSDGIAVASANLAAGDVQAIWCNGGNLSVIGTMIMHDNAPTDFKIKTNLGPCLAIGNGFPNNDVFVHRERVVALGNFSWTIGGAYADDGNAYPIGPELEQMLGYWPTASLCSWRPTLMNTVTPHGLTSADWWNANATHTKNLCGKVTIAGAAVLGVVAFARNEVDANYNVTLTVEHATGAPATTCAFVAIGTKAVGGFTAQLDAAPGGGATVVVTWIITR